MRLGGLGALKHTKCGQRLPSLLAKSTAQSEGERPEAAADRIFQNLGLILHRENARAILRRATPASTADSSILAAAISAAAVEAPVGD